MKKFLLLSVCALALVGCGSGQGEETASSEAVSVEEVEEVTDTETKNIPEEEMGEGTFHLVNESGSTEGGNPITVFYEPDTFGIDFGIDTYDFDGSHLTYIYVDGVMIESQQLSDSQSQLDVPDDILSIEGDHTVSLVQYDNDEEDGEPITVKHQQFIVKK